MADEVYKALSLLFRIALLGLSVAAIVVMGTASQLVIVDGNPESSSYSVSYSQYNALRYLTKRLAQSHIHMRRCRRALRSVRRAYVQVLRGGRRDRSRLLGGGAVPVHRE